MSSVVDLKTKEEKDAELDRRIEALRKKNEALVKRYQEIEEDKKKAELEGIAVTMPRKPRPHEPETDRRKMEKENFTVTVNLSKPAGEKRVVNDWKPGTPRGRKSSNESEGVRGQGDSHSPNRRTGSTRGGRLGHRGGSRQEKREREPRTPREGEPGESGRHGRRGARRGGEGGGGETRGGIDRKSKEWEEKRRQNIEKMNEEMERIAEYERGQRDGDKPIRNFLDDPRRSGPAPDTDRKEGSRRHVRNWGGLDFENVKTGAELEREWTSRRPGPKDSVDMTMSMTGRERAEYLRWKKEREQIDEERLARHRNATGQWRREWDAQKTDNMFKEDPYMAAEGTTSEQQGSRRGEPASTRTDKHDAKRQPKAPTFGDFLSQGKSQGPRGERGRMRGRGQKQSYSMHDNRWEGEKEEKEKVDKTKMEKTKKDNEEEKMKSPPAQKVEEKNKEEDDDEWEDATDEEEEEVSDSEHNSRGNEKKDSGKEKPANSQDDSQTTPTACSPPALSGSPKEQRTPRPKVHIPPPAIAQESPEGGKPVSPFSPLDGHQPVSDWGEEMEMLSPRSSMGGESPLKPPSVEASPPQKKTQAQEMTQNKVPSSTDVTERPEEKHTDKANAQAMPTEPPDALPLAATPSEISVPPLLEFTEAAQMMDKGSPAPPSPAETMETAVLPVVLMADQPADGINDVTAPTGAETIPTTEEVEALAPTSSG
ncbi:coiled-coil domain-containing protein 9 isoform X3 [Echeneis naucrates]|uniref:coiled-coil domain-containing protein 9 isoform X3 n=1 Tax=Echeneis naucrates TaxID=173247 RepID=UPI001113CE95|nr:coiled-coil domain-containing protein 9 isoform X3 [Echeneis naucrates]